MFFDLRRRRKLASGASHPSDPPGDEETGRISQQSTEWRRCAQKVTRAWNEWLAADRGVRAERWLCYLSALAEEERAAAALERTVNIAATGGARGRFDHRSAPRS